MGTEGDVESAGSPFIASGPAFCFRPAYVGLQRETQIHYYSGVGGEHNNRTADIENKAILSLSNAP